MWICPNCETENNEHDLLCVVCDCIKPNVDVDSISQVRMIADDTTRSILEKIIDEKLWGKINRFGTKADYTNYLSLFPSGTHHVAAKNRVAKFEAEEKAEADLWSASTLSNTESDYRYYISRYPEGVYVSEAKERINAIILAKDELAWEKTIKKNTIKGYRDYLVDSSTNNHRDEAEERIGFLQEEQDWAHARTSDTISSYQKYLNKHSDPSLCPHWAEARSSIHRLMSQADDDAWARAKNIDTIDSYQSYLNRSDCVNHRSECIDALDGLLWSMAKSTNTLHSYQNFMSNQHGKKYAKECAEAIKSLKQSLDDDAWSYAARGNTLESYKSYQSQFPAGRHKIECDQAIREQEEKRKWENTCATNTVQTYQRYLQEFPKGVFSSEAQKRIQKLSSHSSGGWVVILLALLVGFIIYIVAINNSSYTSPTPIQPKPVEQVKDTYRPQTPSLSVSELTDLETKTEGLLKALELAKKSGYQRDPNIYNQAKKNIELLKQNASGRYNDFKKRYDAL